MKRSTHVAVLVAALAVAACSDGPVTPRASTQPQFSSAEHELKVARFRSGRPDVPSRLAVKNIGPNGGSLTLSGFEVVVPAGAVSRPTLFSIRLPESDYVYAEFGPHGAQFSVPVTVILPVKGTTSEGAGHARVLWNNGTLWIPLQSSMTFDGRVQAATNHFSEYGTEQVGVGKGITPVGN